MADTYKVISKTLPVRSTKGSKGKILKTLKKGAEVKVYTKEMDKDNKQWGNIASKGAKWVNMEHLKKLGSDKDKKVSEEDEEDSDGITNAESYESLLLQYVRAFGAPPRFSKEVDPWYGMKDSVGVGRAMASTWFSNPSILSICPGTVNYLPGWSKKKKNKLFKEIQEKIGDEYKKSMKKDFKKDMNGQLYSFKSDYPSFISIVNMMARICAGDLGIGGVDDMMEGSNSPLGSFDYAYVTEPSKSGANSLFKEALQTAKDMAFDTAYIHFFTNHSGTSTSENITTEAGQSWLEQQLGSGSQLDTASKNIQFLFGGAISQSASSDIQRIINDARTSNELLGGFATIAKNYINGGRLVFPQMITGVNYSKSCTVETTFMSPSGDRRSIFKYVILPSLHLLALSLPKQLTSNMYTYPFLVKIHQPGVVDMDLAYISSLDLTRGGSDGTSYTYDHLPTEITARFTVTPLYSNLMVTSSRNPWLALCNGALMSYLGNMCGLDLHINGMKRLADHAKSLMSNAFNDIPTNAARDAGGGLGSAFGSLLSLMGMK